MKKKLVSWLGLPVFFLSVFSLFFPGKVWAANSHCTSSGLGYVVGGSFCESEGFNCNNPIELSKEECEGMGYCWEVISAGTLATSQCFAPLNVTTSPDDCGYLGRDCCVDNVSEDYYCLEGQGEPTEGSLGLSCVCTNENEDDESYYSSSPEYINTAIGEIPTDINELITWLFPKLLGIGGIAAFIMIVVSGVQILTSAGNPDKIQGAKETITSAITGLIFIILSLFLLRLVGVDILQLPGLE